MSTELLERPGEVLDRTDRGEGEVAHIVAGKARVVEAYITGQELVAVCGERFIPTRDPENKPVCSACRAALHRTVGGSGSGGEFSAG